MRAALAALVAAALLALAPAAWAACPQTTLADVEDEVMCPVCGTPLSTSTEAPQAIRERELIRSLIQRCQSKEQIKSVLVTEFGEGVLAQPDDEGFDLAAYVVPVVAVLGGVALLLFTALRWRRRRGAGDGEPAAAAPAGQARARLDSDLERYEL